MKINKKKIHPFLLLHFLLFMYSLLGIFSKFAAMETFLSPKFILCYGIVIINLGLYAIVWQQIIKKLSLVTAFANKAITVIWGIVWGKIFFQETITVKKIIGALIIMAGIVLVVMEGKND